MVTYLTENTLQKSRVINMITTMNKLCANKLYREIDALKALIFKANFSKLAPKSHENGECVISCKRSKYNHYSEQIYTKFDEITLASKGWNNSRSKGDYFIIQPDHDFYYKEERTNIHQMDIDAKLVEGLQELEVTELTVFQVEATSVISSGKHAMLAAETGCGKTIAYLLPIIRNLMNIKKIPQLDNSMNTPKALIILPNRELAIQVSNVATVLAERIGLQVKCIIGGRTKKLMLNPEFSEVDLLIGTPGAIGKLCSAGVYRLNSIQYTVLDEADTLTDDSFLERINSIMKRVPQSQVVFVAATMPKKLPDIFEPIKNNLVHVVSPLLHVPRLNITQRFLRLLRSEKPSQLLLIAHSSKDPTIIFTNRSETCNWLAMFLRENNIPCSNINGDMNYAIRIEQWKEFCKGNTKFLSATDVASRGLDTKQVKHIVNYDFPLYAADYIHRIGRTGRFGSSDNCKATNFIAGTQEVKLIQQIELAVRKNQPLANVDGNIRQLVQDKIRKKIQDVA